MEKNIYIFDKNLMSFEMMVPTMQRYTFPIFSVEKLCAGKASLRYTSKYGSIDDGKFLNNNWVCYVKKKVKHGTVNETCHKFKPNKKEDDTLEQRALAGLLK